MASVLVLRMKQRAVIKFFTAERYSLVQIHIGLKAVYSEACIDVSTV